MEYPDGVKCSIQDSLIERYGNTSISPQPRKDAFSRLVCFLFAYHFTLVEKSGRALKGEPLGVAIDRLIAASVAHYATRLGPLSATDYLSDIFDIVLSQDLAIALK